MKDALNKFLTWYRDLLDKNRGATIVGTLIIIFFLLAVAGSAFAADYQLGVDTEKTITCTDATTRTDGSSLAASDIQEVIITVTGPGGFSQKVVMIGGCRATDLPLTDLTAGVYNMTGVTKDTGDRVSVSSAPVPFTLLAPIPANPNPPVNIQ